MGERSQHPSQLLAILNLPPTKWDARSSVIRTIYRLETLIGLTPKMGWIDAGYLSVLDDHKNYPIRNWLPNYQRVCLKCLGEQGSISIEWEYPFSTVCREHNVYLEHRCPNCKSDFVWDYKLQTHCQFCQVKWESTEYRTAKPASWQDYWDGTFDKRRFRYEFSNSILKAARPNRLTVDSSSNFDINPEIHRDLLKFAWQIFNDPFLLDAFHYGLIQRLPGSKRYRSFNAAQIKTATNFIQQNRLGLISNLLPVGFKFSKDKAALDNSVNALEAIRLLGLDEDLELDKDNHPSRDQFLFRLRSAIPVLESLGLTPLENEKRVTRLQYNLSEILKIKIF